MKYSKATQVTVFINNMPGNLSNALKALNTVDFSIQESEVFGPLRFISKDPSVLERLHECGFETQITQVLSISCTNTELFSVLVSLAAHGINIDYAYRFGDVFYAKVNKLDYAMSILNEVTLCV